MRKDSALVILSGGQDSTTCLYWAKQKFKNVSALTINYGQRHLIEIEAAKKIARMANVNHQIISTDLLSTIGNSALVNQIEQIDSQHSSNQNLPASFVPGRNLLFILIAAIYGYKSGIQDLVVGVCQTDFSGYPDCRRDTINSMEKTLTLGLGMVSKINIHTPLMYISKAESVSKATQLPGCMEALAYSHTCYEGQIPPCGKCPACILRAKGFKEADVLDPLLEKMND